MSELTPGWTMGDAEDARRRLLDVAERCGWQVKEDDPDNDWIRLADAVARVEALEKEVAAWKLAATFDDWSGLAALRGEEER